MNIRDITISKRDSLVQLLLYRKVNIKRNTMRVKTNVYDEVSFSYLCYIEQKNGNIITIWWNNFYHKWESCLCENLTKEWQDKVMKIISHN